MLPFCFTAFVAFGIVLVLVGANQRELESTLGLSLAQSGLLASSLSLGLGVGVVGAGPLFDRLPRRPLFAGSLALAGASLASLGPGLSYERWLVHVTVTGLGIGAYDTLINGAVAQRFRESSARPMTAMHTGASLGAILGPPMVGLVTGLLDWTASFVVVGWAHLALAAGALVVPFPGPTGAGGAARSEPMKLGVALWPLGVVAFAYVGIEACLTLFAVPYAEGLGLTETRGRLGISALWLGLLAGRIAAIVVRGADVPVLMAGGALAALALGGSTLTASHALEASLFVVGFALGGVYPIVIALAARRAPGAEGTAAGLVAGAGAIGGFAIPWATGALGDAAGIASAFGSVALWCALISGGAMLARRLAARTR